MRPGGKGSLCRLRRAATQLHSHDAIVRYHDDLVATSGMTARLIRIRVGRIPAPDGHCAAAIVADLRRGVLVWRIRLLIRVVVHVVGCVGRGRRRIGEEQAQVVALDDLGDLAGLDIVYLDKGRLECQNVWIMESYTNIVSIGCGIMACYSPKPVGRPSQYILISFLVHQPALLT